MDYIAIYAAAIVEGNLRKQVAIAIFRAAVDVRNESAQTENHVARLDWANRVLRDGEAPVNEAAKWIWKVLENTTIQANPEAATDNDVQFVVNGLIDTFIGAAVSV